MSLTIARTTTVVASIPSLLGFFPDDSLVLITALANDDGSVTTGPLARIDLTRLTGHADDCARHFNRQCGNLPVSCVIGIVVRTVDEDAAGNGSFPQRTDVDGVIEQLAEHGFTDVDVVHVPAIAEGARWRSYLDADRTGVLPDPATTAAAAAAVAAGHTIAASRDDVAARFTPAPEPLRARLGSRIAAATTNVTLDEQHPTTAAARLTRADTAIRAAIRGELPADDADIVDLAATFATLPFRDALLAVPDDASRLAAENLVLHLWRHSCVPLAGRLATVVAVHAYLRGDGTGARIALEHADPRQPLMRLLTHLLNLAVPPSEVHDVIHNASTDARRTLLSEPATGPDEIGAGPCGVQAG